MKPLPTPQRGGTLNELTSFINLETEQDRVLVIGWLVGSLHPNGPYPVLALHGKSGSAKSSAACYLRSIVDPNTVPAPKPPRDSEDITLKAHHNWIVAFDNMSSMPQWLSDCLCRLSTGAGDSKRELYADSEQVIFSAKRPCIINGIEELAAAGDLLDRAIIITLPRIPSDRYREEEEMNAAYEEAQPRLLGALLDAVSAAICNRHNVNLKQKPRMADFAKWVTASEEALGWEPYTFMQAYTSNKADARNLEVEASPVARAVCLFMQDRPKWTGSSQELLAELKRRVDMQETQHYTWPKNGQALSGKLRRLADALMSQGIEVEWTHSGSRSITLRTVGKPSEEGVDALDAKILPFPTSNSGEKEEKEEIGKPRKTSSNASMNGHDLDAMDAALLASINSSY